MFKGQLTIAMKEPTTKTNNFKYHHKINEEKKYFKQQYKQTRSLGIDFLILKTTEK